jgi:hypothetical protein
MRDRIQEFRSCRSSVGEKIWREGKGTRLVSKAYGEESPDWKGSRPKVHSATPVLLNSCNSCNSLDYVRV